jgi:predicted nucleotidyltransferase
VTMVAGLEFDMQRLSDLCRRYGIARLEIFGSAARGEATDDSDVDLLYELGPGSALGWEIADLEDELSELFGRPVDLVSKRALHPELRPIVQAEARELYAA